MGSTEIPERPGTIFFIAARICACAGARRLR